MGESDVSLAQALEDLATQAAELEAKNEKLLVDYERIEGEYQSLKLRSAAAGTLPPAPASDNEDLARLQRQNEAMKRKCDLLEAALVEKANSSDEGTVVVETDELNAIKADFELLEGELEEAKAKLEASNGATAKVAELRAKLEAAESEVRELAELRTQASASSTSDAEVAQLKAKIQEYEKAGEDEVLPAGEAVIMARISRPKLMKLRLKLNKLESENKKLRADLRASRESGTGSGLGSATGTVGDESELDMVKRKATRTIKRLKQEAETAKHQRENLMKALAERDAGGSTPDLTLEQITDSPVFKTMLGNIRRTSREEVTLLHDAVVALGKVEPDAYNAVLDVAAATFKAANVENPLALLKKKEPTS